MGVYVDQLRDWGWRLGPSCHLIADTDEELHQFAVRIGLKRAWFQGEGTNPHYDLTAGRRLVAVRMGAIQLPDREFVEKLRGLRGEIIKRLAREE